MAPIFDPGGYLTPGESTKAAIDTFAAAIEKRRARARELEDLLLTMDPDTATSVVNSLGERGLRQRGLSKKRAMELALTVSSGGQVRASTPEEIRKQQLGEVTLQQQRQEASGGALKLGVLKQQVGEALIDTRTNLPLDPGRRSIQLARLERGEPLENARFDDRVVAAARDAGFGDDVGAFIQGQRERFETGTRAGAAQAAGAELGTIAATRGMGMFDVATGGVRELTPEERAQLAKDPFSVHGIVLPDELQSQVQSWARTFFGGDEDKATQAISALTVELPTEQARTAMLSSKANIAYLTMLTKRLGQEIIAAAAEAKFGKPLTPEQTRLALNDLEEAYKGSVGRVMGGLRSVTGLEIDKKTGQPILGRFFWQGQRGPGQIEIPEQVQTLTIDDITQLVIPGEGESATDRRTLLARVQNLIATKAAAAGVPVQDVTDIDIAIDQGVDSNGNQLPPKHYSLEEFLPLLGQARVSGQRFSQLSQELGLEIGAMGRNVEGEAPRIPRGTTRMSTGQPPTLMQQVPAGGISGGALDEVEQTIFGDQINALKERGGVGGGAASTPSTSTTPSRTQTIPQFNEQHRGGPGGGPPIPGIGGGKRTRLGIVNGNVKVRRAGSFAWIDASPSVPLRPGDIVRTEAGASATIVDPDGTVRRVGPGSMVDIR